MSVKDELAQVLSDSLNKNFKEMKVAYFLDGSDTSPSDITEWVSTGASMLDLSISNKPNGGIAVGRITEINGLESSGKSLLGAHILAETQKKDGLAVYIDSETSVSKDFLEAIGVDVGNMLYLHLETVEDIFESISHIVTKVRESDKDKLVTILVDSLAAATTKVELDNDFDKDGWSTGKAIIISKAMRKITQMIGRERVALVFTNQLRQKLGVMFGDPWTTSGGKALPFHASIRLRLKNMGQIKDKKTNTIGIKCRAQVIKSRLGPPLRHADFQLYFDSGIDDYAGWLGVLKDYNLVKQGGAWYTFEEVDTETGEIVKTHKFQLKDWAGMLTTNENLKKYAYDLICEKKILHYQEPSVTDKVVAGDK